MSGYLEKRRARHQAATAGPWDAFHEYDGGHGVAGIAQTADGFDADYIAAARNDEAKTLAVLEAGAKLGPEHCARLQEFGAACPDVSPLQPVLWCPVCRVCAAVAALPEATDGHE